MRGSPGLHALLYASELKERGGEARLVFDGASTAWLARFRDPTTDSDRHLSTTFDKLKGDGLVYEVCDFCSGAFGAKSQLSGEPMSAKYMDHPSIVDLVEDGLQIWIL